MMYILNKFSVITKMTVKINSKTLYLKTITDVRKKFFACLFSIHNTNEMSEKKKIFYFLELT